MERIQIAFTLFAIGLAGTTLVGIFSNLFHKWKKINSFMILETPEQIVIKNTPLMNKLSSIGYFFSLSTFSFLIAANTFNIYIEFTGIYSICLIITIRGFIRKRNFKVVIEKGTNTIHIKSKKHPLADNSIEISSIRNWRWILEDVGATSYGLYLKSKSDKYILIYGYSIYRDIESLRNQLSEKLAANTNNQHR